MSWRPRRAMLLALLLLCAGCLLRFGAGQAESDDDAGLEAAEAESPSASIPLELQLPQGRSTELALLTAADPVVNGTRTAYILQSTTIQFHLVLQLQDVGNESFCWMAVINAVKPSELAWRAPCAPVKATSCCVRFTTRGDLQLFLPETMSVAWQTNTSDRGVKILRLLDYGTWLLLRTHTEVVWQTSQHPVPKNCLIPGPILMDNASLYAPPSPLAAESGNCSRHGSLLAVCCLIGLVVVFLVF
ncbi:hypothetical protein MPTK1_2g12920 [Marchantia polymorpha subsp. ruderalis]|nr:hypothetical protein MARPO_0026s0080 [Marchantia polymorpha]BBN02115.1 hypothetical protein Mp_2g12920 [Marchantia polymorpha subsp. ruderalis]|eukprot:PTQ43205.1 hypothetical protein MARPO_0026s0080 [Marchantia polymorpha]